jgi:L-aminopeptidase/D-esterase-like protein
MITNDNTDLEPRTSFTESLRAFNFPGFQIGVAEYEVGPTGCTVFYFPGGAIVSRQGVAVRGHLDPRTGKYHSSSEDLERSLAHSESSTPPQGNTTLTVVVTNQKTSGMAFRQLARQVHASMARAIQPFQTVWDGDTLFAVTTNEVENPGLNEVALAVAASETVWDAVLSIVNLGK